MEPNQKLIAKKEEWAKFKRGLSEDGVMQDHRPGGGPTPTGPAPHERVAGSRPRHPPEHPA